MISFKISVVRLLLVLKLTVEINTTASTKPCKGAQYACTAANTNTGAVAISVILFIVEGIHSITADKGYIQRSLATLILLELGVLIFPDTVAVRGIVSFFADCRTTFHHRVMYITTIAVLRIHTQLYNSKIRAYEGEASTQHHASVIG